MMHSRGCRQRIGFSLEIETPRHHRPDNRSRGRQRIGFSLEIETSASLPELLVYVLSPEDWLLA